MALPPSLCGRLRVPVIGAPMFLVSTPPLVTALCQAGVVGAFPHVNARPSEQLGIWLERIQQELVAIRAKNPNQAIGPLAVNLIVHRTNARYEPDLALVVQHEVPLVITCLGHPGRAVEAVHGYGGLVFADVVNAEFARKAIDAGVDGLICVGAGAGGHAGTQSAFSLVREIREFWDGCLVLGGAINDGYQIRAAEVLGADLAYIGTRFIATEESAAAPEYKRMLIDAGVEDLVYTDRFSGVHANYLLPSIARYGIEIAKLPPKRPDTSELAGTQARTWKDIWSAGQGVATIHDAPPVAQLVSRMAAEYQIACGLPPSAALAAGLAE